MDRGDDEFEAAQHLVGHSEAPIFLDVGFDTMEDAEVGKLLPEFPNRLTLRFGALGAEAELTTPGAVVTDSDVLPPQIARCA